MAQIGIDEPFRCHCCEGWGFFPAFSFRKHNETGTSEFYVHIDCIEEYARRYAPEQREELLMTAQSLKEALKDHEEKQ
jgi:hypothetical protein